MYAGACSFGLMTVLRGRGFTGDDVAPTWSVPYIDPGRPPCVDGKYDPPGVADGGGGAALLYMGYPACWACGAYVFD